MVGADTGACSCRGLDKLSLGLCPFGLIGAGVSGGLEGPGLLVVLDSEAVRRALRREERVDSGVWMDFGIERGAGRESVLERVTDEVRRALRRARSASSEEDILCGWLLCRR